MNNLWLEEIILQCKKILMLEKSVFAARMSIWFWKLVLGWLSRKIMSVSRWLQHTFASLRPTGILCEFLIQVWKIMITYNWLMHKLDRSLCPVLRVTTPPQFKCKLCNAVESGVQSINQSKLMCCVGSPDKHTVTPKLHIR